MSRTRIKICGVARVEDARAAARAGADAIGMVLHAPSARNVPLERARQILGALPAFVTPVGLFVDAPTRVILDTADELRLRHVQLHGHESPGQIAELRGLTVLKAFRVRADSMELDLSIWRNAHAALDLQNLQGLVLETSGTAQAGGTGVENDWATILRHLEAGHFEGLPPIIAAGGLRPDNVAAVVRDLRPWAVDVSSGVEAVPGHKSPEKIDAFIRAVRDGDAQT